MPGHVLQVVNNTGPPGSSSAVDISLQMIVEATAAKLTSVFVFLAGDAISQLTSNLNRTGKWCSFNHAQEAPNFMLSSLLQAAAL